MAYNNYSIKYLDASYLMFDLDKNTLKTWLSNSIQNHHIVYLKQCNHYSSTKLGVNLAYNNLSLTGMVLFSMRIALSENW